MNRLALLLSIAAALSAASPDYDYYLTGNARNVERQTKAGFVLAGGGGDVDEAMRWFLERAGGGDIVVLRASGSDGYNDYMARLSAVDSVESIVFKSPNAARDPFVLERIRNAEGLFFAGGDQWNYIRYWKNTPVEDAIHELARKGVPIGGTSAGLAILGEYSFSAEFDTVTSAQAMADPFDKRVAIERDFLRFPALKGWITDSHFMQRERMGRLIAFLARTGAPVLGVGVDERTALLVEPDGASRVVGGGSVYFLKPAAAAEVCEPGRPLRYRNVPGIRVRAGSEFHLQRWAGGEAFEASVDNGVLTTSGLR